VNVNEKDNFFFSLDVINEIIKDSIIKKI